MITLTTDFGTSEYVGAMKGVIYSICPTAAIVDITHAISKFDIRRAAYIVYSACKYFPKETIHVVVVDPEVGTKRRGIIVDAGKHVYIGPDNGVFTLIGDTKRVFEISLKSKSKTFHGRDIFAPIAAKLACGAKIEEFGKKSSGIKKIEFREVKIRKREISGEVMCIDGFGNAITNIKKEAVDSAGIKYGDALTLKVKGKKQKIKFLESYGFANKGELISLIGSENFLEIAVNQGNAGRKVGIKGGEAVEVSK